MDGTNPKVSFIPKSSLVREESFLERPRPRSVMGILAIVAFFASAGSYAGLYYSQSSLEKQILAKAQEIKNAQSELSSKPQIERAKLFRSRALLAQELLNTHTLVSPVLSFVSTSTISSVMYDKFSLTHKAEGTVLELSGEAPTYAALAYQGDVLREKTKELANVSIHNVSLTSFGTVLFTLTMTFNPAYPSYIRNLGVSESMPAVSQTSEGVSAPLSSGAATSTAGAIVPPVELPVINATSTVSDAGVGSSTTTASVPVVSPVTPVKAITAVPRQSFLSSLWARFKFW